MMTEEETVWMILEEPIPGDVGDILKEMNQNPDCKGRWEWGFKGGIRFEFYQYDSSTGFENAVRVDAPKEKIRELKETIEKKKNKKGYISMYNLIWLSVYAQEMK